MLRISYGKVLRLFREIDSRFLQGVLRDAQPHVFQLPKFKYPCVVAVSCREPNMASKNIRSIYAGFQCGTESGSRPSFRTFFAPFGNLRAWLLWIEGTPPCVQANIVRRTTTTGRIRIPSSLFGGDHCAFLDPKALAQFGCTMMDSRLPTLADCIHPPR